jgi:hypothetical protein
MIFYWMVHFKIFILAWNFIWKKETHSRRLNNISATQISFEYNYFTNKKMFIVPEIQWLSHMITTIYLSLIDERLISSDVHSINLN